MDDKEIFLGRYKALFFERGHEQGKLFLHSLLGYMGVFGKSAFDLSGCGAFLRYKIMDDFCAHISL